MSDPSYDPDAHPTVPLDVGDAIPPRPPAPATDDAPTLPIPVQAPQYSAPQAPAHPTAALAHDGPAPEHPAPRPRRRRGAIIALVVLVVLAGLGIAGWFAGEAWARQAVVTAVQEQTREALGLPDDHAVDVETATPVLPQLIGGSLDELTISSADVPLGSVVGDITAHATDVTVRGEPAAGSATARVTLSAETAQQLIASSTGMTVLAVELASPDVIVGLDPDYFLSGVDVAITLRPSAADGQLVLSPEAFDVGGWSMPAETVRREFGDFAESMLGPRTVCVAATLPKALTLTDVTVRGDGIDVDVDIDPRVVEDASLREKGSCG